jgi:dTDP-4-amino-4,6-dideoxygalactose transaminase
LMSERYTNAREIPFVDLKSEYLEIQQEVSHSLERVLQQTAFILGRDVLVFERSFAEFCQSKHAVGVANGTDALILALKAIGLQPGDEVLLPVNTFIATAEAIIHAGGQAVFVDVNPGTYLIDLEDMARKITPKTKVMIPVHLYGQPAPMDPILKVAGERGLTVIEDAAQAHGASYKGRKVGSFGRAGCFSFYPSKNLGCYGDGGAVVTDDDVVAEMLRKLREHGGIVKYRHDVIGYNSRLDTLQAAILSVKLQRLEEWNERRRSSALLYNQLLAEIPGVRVPHVSNDVIAVYHLYEIRVESGLRPKLQAYLRERGIQTGIHYPTPLHLTGAFSFLGHSRGDFPNAEALSDQLLSLPMHPYLQPDQIDYIASQIAQFIRANA